MSNVHTGFSAIVTGGNSGIGKATAERLLNEGAQVLIVDQHAERTWTHPALGYIQADVADASSADLIVQQMIKNTGRLDYLINNAGMVGGTPVETMEFETWQRIIDVNLNAVFRLSKSAIPHLKMSPRGRIVNIGSIMSQLAGVGMAAYTASKHAIGHHAKEDGC
ncbi:MAG: SDR family NAD(P)-dependent oxidoreductase [Pseudomonadales bacterium]